MDALFGASKTVTDHCIGASVQAATQGASESDHLFLFNSYRTYMNEHL